MLEQCFTIKMHTSDIVHCVLLISNLTVVAAKQHV